MITSITSKLCLIGYGKALWSKKNWREVIPVKFWQAIVRFWIFLSYLIMYFCKYESGVHLECGSNQLNNLTDKPRVHKWYKVIICSNYNQEAQLKIKLKVHTNWKKYWELETWRKSKIFGQKFKNQQENTIQNRRNNEIFFSF